MQPHTSQTIFFLLSSGAGISSLEIQYDRFRKGDDRTWSIYLKIIHFRQKIYKMFFLIFTIIIFGEPTKYILRKLNLANFARKTFLHVTILFIDRSRKCVYKVNQRLEAYNWKFWSWQISGNFRENKFCRIDQNLRDLWNLIVTKINSL